MDEYIRLLQNGDDGTGSTSFKLYDSADPEGATRDDDRGDSCLSMHGTRRVGICNDGIYKLDLRMTDTAGNPGSWVSREVERDTVDPVRPSVSVGKSGNKLSGEYLNIDIRGESNATALIKVTSSLGQTYNLRRKLNSSGHYSSNNLIGRLVCDYVVYTVTVKLEDRAENIGQLSIPQSVTTGECPYCGLSEGGALIKPIHNDDAYIGFPYGFSQQYFNNTKFHSGVDYNGVSQGEPIYAAAPGKVIRVAFGYANNGSIGNTDGYGYGNHVYIDHGYGLVTRYAHMLPESNPPVQVGDQVTPGTQIGRIGNSGNSTGVHLHFEVILNGERKNPEIYLGKESTNLTPEEFAAYCDRGGTGGTAEKPWGGEKIDDVYLHIKKDRNGSVSTENFSPDPKITYMTPENNELNVFGVAPYKHANVKFKYEEEVCDGWFCWLGIGYRWEIKEEGEKELKHVEVKLKKDNHSGSQIASVWNDTPQDGRYGYRWNDQLLTHGRWVTNGALPGDSDPISIGGGENQVNYGQQVCVTSITYLSRSEGWPVDYTSARDGNCEKVRDMTAILLDVPLIREDVCDKQEYESQPLHGNPSCSGYLCRSLGGGENVTGCHVIAMAMVESFFKNKTVNLNEYNSSYGQYGCDLNWYAEGRVQPTYIYRPYEWSGLEVVRGSSGVDLSVPNPNRGGKLYSDSIDGELKQGRPVIIQIQYGASSTLHAFVISGKKDGQYLVNDQFYGQSGQTSLGKRFTTLEHTIIDRLLNQGGQNGSTDTVKVVGLYFFTFTDHTSEGSIFLDPETIPIPQEIDNPRT